MPRSENNGSAIIKIIDYKAGNAPSVLNAVRRLGYGAGCAGLAQAPCDLDGATHIILPGVGSAKATMESLGELGFVQALGEAVLGKKALFLGICVGMQLLFEHSEEGDVDCFGWLSGQVVKYDVRKVRVPQMGWNEISFVDGMSGDGGGGGGDGSSGDGGSGEGGGGGNGCGGGGSGDGGVRSGFFYFVNSYYAVPERAGDIWGVADYGGIFAAAVRRDNIFATQFHVEKSGEAGLLLLGGFLGMKGGV
ncbi:MAG: imidazole glycerol phosphate synthase subunit HisH [Oscillospiraceae bacterium]|nr:imidazole glycerol phosphate synthase subunit HisH [Oscillospiraceae bacterium]